MMRVHTLFFTALLLAACRSSGTVPVDGGVADLQALPPCTSEPSCLACCTARFESGALDYDTELMSCACTATACASACASTVCGTGVGVDSACRQCLAGTLADGGVCLSAASDCLVNAGPCAGFADCVAACP
jgi:hypothetical protein